MKDGDREAAFGSGGVPASVSRTRLCSSLVTRPTGRAVRLSIQERIAGHAGPVLGVLDFRDVPVIDFSCADEVAAKLAEGARDGEAGRGGLFLLFTGLEKHHLDPVESALRRRELVVAAERADGSPAVLGELEEEPLRAWHGLARRGEVEPEALAGELGLAAEGAEALLETLHRRRLVLRGRRAYVSLRRAAAAAREDA